MLSYPSHSFSCSLQKILLFSACNTVYYISKHPFKLRHQLKSIVLLDTKWSWVATTLNPHYEGRISRIYGTKGFFYPKLHRLLSQGALVPQHTYYRRSNYCIFNFALNCLISLSPSSFSYRYNLYGTLYTGNTQLCYE
jgi:hypothetical protein